MKKAENPWLDAGMHAVSLCFDAAFVIPLRSARIARGGSAGAHEAWLMVSEKVAAAATLQSSLLSGRLGHDPGQVTARVMGHYARKVRANRKRLGG